MITTIILLFDSKREDASYEKQTIQDTLLSVDS